MALQYGEELSRMEDTSLSTAEAKNGLSEKVSMFKLATTAMVKVWLCVDLITWGLHISHDYNVYTASTKTNPTIEHAIHRTGYLYTFKLYIIN